MTGDDAGHGAGDWWYGPLVPLRRPPSVPATQPPQGAVDVVHLVPAGVSEFMTATTAQNQWAPAARTAAQALPSAQPLYRTLLALSQKAGTDQAGLASRGF